MKHETRNTKHKTQSTKHKAQNMKHKAQNMKHKATKNFVSGFTFHVLLASFTLIELLVVIAIIGTLSALLLPNFMSARQKARDANRKSDIKQIQKALELYKLDQVTPAYPDATSNALYTAGYCMYSTSPGAGVTCATGANIYMSKIPADPQSQAIPTPYYYSKTSQLEYKICSCLENTADPDGQLCAGNCTGITCTGTNPKCYVATQP